MKVRNIETGVVEGLRYEPAMAAVAAGTHEIVNDPETLVADTAKAEKSKPVVKAAK
jgi:hypothetical protein